MGIAWLLMGAVLSGGLGGSEQVSCKTFWATLLMMMMMRIIVVLKIKSRICCLLFGRPAAYWNYNRYE